MIPLGVLGGAHHMATPPTALITDTFTRPDATGLGTTETGDAAWTYGSGTSGTSTWQVLSGTAAKSSPSGTHSVALVDVGTADMEIAATVTLAGSGTQYPGIVARGTPNGSSGYLVWLGTTTVQVTRRILSGQQSTLYTSDMPRGDGIRLRLRTVEEGGATRIIAYADDVEIYTALDTLPTRPLGTHGGLFALNDGCRLDDFQAEAL